MPGDYHYLDTGESALVVRGDSRTIAANFLQNGNALFYHDVTTFGTTTTPTLQTTLVKARNAAGLVLTTSGGTVMCQSAENGDLMSLMTSSAPATLPRAAYKPSPFDQAIFASTVRTRLASRCSVLTAPFGER